MPILLVLILLSACARERQPARPGAETPTVVSSPSAGHNGSLPTLAPEMVSTWFARMDVRVQPVARQRDSVAVILRRDSGTTSADSLFIAFRGRYASTIDSIGRETWDDAPFQNWLISSAAASDSAERFFEARGLRLTSSEGSAYPTENTGVLGRTLKPFLTAALRAFLALREHDEAQGFSDDAALQIPWDSVGERVTAWERLLNAHPAFVAKDEAQWWYDLYLSTYLTGMDNSPVFDDTLAPALRASYQRFVRLHRDTRAGRLVRAYLDVLQSTGFRSAPPVAEFLRANNIASMAAVQPPIR
jgi:hypothetical protein